MAVLHTVYSFFFPLGRGKKALIGRGRLFNIFSLNGGANSKGAIIRAFTVYMHVYIARHCNARANTYTYIGQYSQILEHSHLTSGSQVLGNILFFPFPNYKQSITEP